MPIQQQAIHFNYSLVFFLKASSYLVLTVFCVSLAKVFCDFLNTGPWPASFLFFNALWSGPLVLEATAMSNVPQPLSKHCLAIKHLPAVQGHGYFHT